MRNESRLKKDISSYRHVVKIILILAYAFNVTYLCAEYVKTLSEPGSI